MMNRSSGGTKVAPRDSAFDPFLCLQPEAQALLETTLLPEILSSEVRRRQRSSSDARNLLWTASAVVANAIRAESSGLSGHVHYSRMRSTYSNSSKGLYYPDFIGSKLLCGLIDLMKQGGWLTTNLGAPLRGKRERFRRRSTFGAKRKLLARCASLGISHGSTHVLNTAPVLILRDKKGIPLWYDREEHRREIITLRAVNRFLSGQKLTLDYSDEDREMVASLPQAYERYRTWKVYPPDESTARLYRVFNNADWKQGGRFYGGWWQSIPSNWRSHIQINGSATVELDYSGFLVRAIYHSKGHNYQALDPYDVPTIRERVEVSGDDWVRVRSCVKRATHALVNAKRHHDLSLSPNLSFPPYLNKRFVFEEISRHHSAIAHTFRSGIGMLLMNRESSICSRILLAGLKEQIVVLPIHDSYIVEERHERWLKNQMIDRYVEEFGHPPRIHPDSGQQPPTEVTVACQLQSTPLSPPLEINPSIVETRTRLKRFVAEVGSSDVVPDQAEDDCWGATTCDAEMDGPSSKTAAWEALLAKFNAAKG